MESIKGTTNINYLLSDIISSEVYMSNEKENKKIKKEKAIIKSYGTEWKSIQKGVIEVKKPEYDPLEVKESQKKPKKEAK